MLKKSHSLSVGIVGLPNSGKSTLFNSLTKNSVPAENFPFCTIDKNVGVVEIPDERLKKLADFYNAEKIIPGAIKFLDIAGLVKGASKGEGLGNQFLAHIREVDLILYVLRAFENENVSHVYNRVSPFEDFQIVQSELILKDIEVLENYGGENQRILEFLNKGIPLVEVELTEDEQKIVQDLSLLSAKERIYLLNIREGVDTEGGFWEEEFDGKSLIKTDVKMIGEFLNMDGKEKKEFLSLLDRNIFLVEDIIKKCFERLNLISFYTGNEKECNAWSVVEGANVRDAAGVIHTDLRENFITADVVNIEEMLKVGGWIKAKEKGLVKNHSKDYIVRDGDYILILANKGT